MSDNSAPLGGPGFDPEAIRRKYLEESEKRRSKKSAPSRAVAESTVLSVEDPFVETPLEREPLHDEVDAVVVGGGHTGLMTAVHLRKAGVPRVRLIEKGAGFGGVWYWNRYPGIRCDVDAYSYMPMLEEVGTMPTEKYAQGDEIRAHAQALAEKFGLDESALLQTQVTGARWDEDADRWIVTTDRGDEIRTRFICLGSGTLDNPSIPDVPGLDEFEGHVFHSSRWDYDYTGGNERGGLTKLAGKRVVVVGTAASSIQFIPELAQYAEEVLVVQRTPVIVIPRNNTPTDPEWFRNQPAGWQKERIENLTAVVQSPPGSKPPTQDILDDSLTGLSKMSRNVSPELSALLEGAEPATRMLYGNYAAMEKIRADMASIVNDPDTAEKLKPYYNLGCNRPQFSDTYLQAYNRPNVTLLDTEGHGVEALTAKGVVVGGVEYEADCVVFGTGFEVDAGRFPVAGRGGELLSDKWADGVRSLHGVLTAGFPNLLVVGGIPQATHAINFTHQLYDQATHVSTIVRRCLDEGLASVEVRPEAEERWAQQIKEKAAGLPRPALNCAPNKQSELIHSGYPGGPIAYAQVCREWLQGDGFERDLVVEHSVGTAA
ncbi:MULTISPECIES: flavin-containing monooxygenase [Streptomyces]|uniref:flavin-containing monooxygenase n=1 Tax=Streptomyces lycopersici TaxID=2974589 RepID=UPI0021D01CDC|nr:NAD(P)/FAD-dependent oxidoreductase [Streptomyces sp. NEAU-383]